jgi:hypothetical protein
LTLLVEKYKGMVSFEAIASNGYDLSMPRAQLDLLIAKHHLPYLLVLCTTHRLALKYGAQVTSQKAVH